MNRRDWVKRSIFFPTFASVARARIGESEHNPLPDDNKLPNHSPLIRVDGSADSLWTLSVGSKSVSFAAPRFFIDEKTRIATLDSVKQSSPLRELVNGIHEQRFSGRFADDTSLSLELVFRIAVNCPVVRFRYILHSSSKAKLNGDGAQLNYYSTSLSKFKHCREVQLSAFNEMLHSYTVAEVEVPQSAFEDEFQLVGPILVASDDENGSLIVAYEHGAQVPDSFLEYRLNGQREMTLAARKANYIPGQKADGFSTVWMQAALSKGGVQQLSAQYRDFILRSFSLNQETQRPYVFYNTWNFQERNKWFHSKSYLASMNPERILSEIDVAHRMGIEVFVLDTGWYDKTGDWEVSQTRFPNKLAEIKNRLDGYGMKLGLWFDPTAAAKSSRMFQQSRRCVRTQDGKEGAPHPIWETEESYPMCLVSGYGDAFADALIRVARETGARYFKWDAIAQYGCDSPDHWHGDKSNTQVERWNSYAFQLPLQMVRVVEKVTAAVPGIIIDFDVTEAGRAVGLSFLAVGKYFLINNGPYKFNYDLPFDRAQQNWNLFFYPGPARTWICRSPLTFDKWIPSILFLTHYFPDDPRSSQLINVASLILGQNGIWGDLLSVSREGVEFIGGTLAKYRLVRDDITASDPIMTGAVGSSPEIHEKISRQTGKGALVLFATTKGKFTYITTNRPSSAVWCEGEVSVRFDSKRRAMVEANFTSPGAAIVLFGAE